jgi:hypothetical protein
VEPTTEELLATICAKEPAGEECIGDCADGMAGTFVPSDPDDADSIGAVCIEEADLEVAQQTSAAVLNCLAAADADEFTCEPPLNAPLEVCMTEQCAFYLACYGEDPCE